MQLGRAALCISPHKVGTAHRWVVTDKHPSVYRANWSGYPDRSEITTHIVHFGHNITCRIVDLIPVENEDVRYQG